MRMENNFLKQFDLFLPQNCCLMTVCLCLRLPLSMYVCVSASLFCPTSCVLVYLYDKESIRSKVEAFFIRVVTDIDTLRVMDKPKDGRTDGQTLYSIEIQ